MSARSLRLPVLLVLLATACIATCTPCGAQDSPVDAAVDASSSSPDESDVTAAAAAAAADYDPRRVEWKGVVEACKAIGAR